LQTFDISHAFLPLTIAKLSTFKNGPVFWPTLYYMYLIITAFAIAKYMKY